jgi:hypothetical protein
MTVGEHDFKTYEVTLTRPNPPTVYYLDWRRSSSSATFVTFEHDPVTGTRNLYYNRFYMSGTILKNRFFKFNNFCDKTSCSDATGCTPCMRITSSIEIADTLGSGLVTTIYFAGYGDNIMGVSKVSSYGFVHVLTNSRRTCYDTDYAADDEPAGFDGNDA